MAMSEEVTRVGVVGAGTMGNGIAQVFAQSGFDVTLIDAADGALERARATIDKSLAKLVEKGKLQAGDRSAAIGRIHTGTTLDDLAHADFIVEAIYEDASAKRTLFASLDRITRPEVILA
jgi:3-hydroxybutyryl-CoA dehydrogenase